MKCLVDVRFSSGKHFSLRCAQEELEQGGFAEALLDHCRKFENQYGKITTLTKKMGTIRSVVIYE